MIERLWEAGEYQTWLATRRTKPSVGVHRALIRWPDGVSRDSHLKIVFEDGGRPCRHLAHEAVAWLLARAANLPVPGLAGFIVLTPEQAGRAHPDRPAAETAAWVTSTEPDRTLLINEAMEADAHLARELTRWRDLQATCAFDEWIGNCDRFPRNLLRRKQDEFTLIDHDFMAGGPNWLADLLAAMHFDEFRNVLRDLCSPVGVGDPAREREFSSAMVLHSERFPHALTAVMAEVNDWIIRLLDDADDQTALAAFVAARADASQNLIRRRYKLIL